MTTARRLSLEDFLALPEEKPYAEFLYGEVVVKAMPGFPHSVTQSELARHIGNWAHGAGGSCVTEQRCILATPEQTHVQLPDVAWFPQRPQLRDGSAVSIPTLAGEILSPDDPYSRVQRKVRIYLEAEVPVVWLVDPVERTVIVCRRGQEQLLLSDGDRLADPLLAGLELSLNDLFRPLA